MGLPKEKKDCIVMEITPFVSIVMPAYNTGKYISSAIESMLNQTYRDFELIIINDGSTDDTENEIKKFNDPRIIYLKNEINLNLANSVNKGLRAAKGTYIARMDSDDISVPDRLFKQLQFLEQNPDIHICGSQLEVFGTFTGTMNYPLAHEDLMLRLLITSCFGNNVVVFKRDLIEKHNLYYDNRFTCADDYHCWTRWLLVTKGANLDEYLIKYRTHSKSLSSNKRKQHEEMKQIRKEYMANIFSLKTENEIKLADQFYGPIGLTRIKSIIKILRLNYKINVFNENKFIDIINQLWYLDSLEEVENGHFFTFLYFPLIIKISLKNNLKHFVNLLKHFYITRIRIREKNK